MESSQLDVETSCGGYSGNTKRNRTQCIVLIIPILGSAVKTPNIIARDSWIPASFQISIPRAFLDFQIGILKIKSMKLQSEDVPVWHSLLKMLQKILCTTC